MRKDDTTPTIPHEGSIAMLFGWTVGWGIGAIRAFVAMKGWEWFVADTFGLPTLSFVQTWGLFMLISFAVFQYSNTKNEHGPLTTVMTGLLSSMITSSLYFIGLLILSVFL